MLLCGRFFCRMRRERLSKRKRPARGWPLNAGEERLLQTGSITQQLRFVGFFPTGNVHDQSDRMLRFLCRSGAADPASESDRMGAGRRTHVPAGSAVQKALSRYRSFHHDGSRFSHADCVGNLNFTTIGQASSNNVFRDITCCVGCGTVHF